MNFIYISFLVVYTLSLRIVVGCGVGICSVQLVFYILLSIKKVFWRCMFLFFTLDFYCFFTFPYNDGSFSFIFQSRPSIAFSTRQRGHREGIRNVICERVETLGSVLYQLLKVVVLVSFSLPFSSIIRLSRRAKSRGEGIGIGISEHVEIPQEQAFARAEWRVEVTTSQYRVEYS